MWEPDARAVAAYLPRVDIEHPLEESQRTCPHHGAELERFGEVVSEQLDIVPAHASARLATATLTSLLSRLETPTPANVPALPGKHRHGRDARPYLALDAEENRVHLATAEDPGEKAPLVLRQLEEERESVPAQLPGLCDPLEIPSYLALGLGVDPILTCKISNLPEIICVHTTLCRESCPDESDVSSCAALRP